MALLLLRRAAEAARRLWFSSFIVRRRTKAPADGLHCPLTKSEETQAPADPQALTSERLRLAIAVGGIGTWDYDPVTNVLEVSPQLRTMFGLSKDARVTRELVLSRITVEDSLRVQEALSGALDPAGDGQYRIKFRMRRADDGEERWISCTGQAFFAGGQAVRLMGTSRDISDEKLAERLLAEKSQVAEQLEMIATCAAALPGVIGTMRRTADGRYCFPYVSANFEDVYGFAPEDVKTDMACIAARRHPEDRRRYEAAIAESARTLSMLHEEFRWEHPRKGMIWLEVQANPIAEPGGGVLWHGYVQDITERKRAEEKLRASDARSRAFFDSNLLGVCYGNGLSGAITDANDKYLEMLGFDREDLVAGRINWKELTPPEFSRINEAAIAELITTGKNQRPTEKEYIRKDGSRLPVLVARAVLDKTSLDGVAFVLDISEQKQNEARAQKLAADRIAVMQSMAAGIAHEINQPLAATVAYLRALRRLLEMKLDQRPISVRETVDRASAQITRAGEIVSRLRSFIAHGEPDKFPVSAHQAIQEAFDAAIASMKEAQIQAKLRLNAADDVVLADKVQIVQVLFNLICNAREAMEPVPRRELVVSTTSSEAEIRIDVIDTGVGLSEKTKSNLFEPFATTKPSGMGVGLSISRAIIEAHHGRIWAESNPEGGAIFSFTLPLASDQIETAGAVNLTGHAA
jgi:PAS domain S-box-containing protein